jgi:hypothetical protein
MLTQQPYIQLQREDKNIRGNTYNIYHKIKHTENKYKKKSHQVTDSRNNNITDKIKVDKRFW